MRIAVIGGTGLIGSQVVKDLNAAGHRAVPHSRSTPAFFRASMDNLPAAASWTASDDSVRLPATPIQPIAAKDVAAEVADVAHKGDTRTVVTDPGAGMFGAVEGDVLTDLDARPAPTRYADWLS
ncbi:MULTISPECIES: NAD-dependent epimerase/dehydratase family protein [unclassified Streptomyces]|uniref:NAD-dependent epimerase/dehydratase family protein n=1 Tax=unclassified Streptomyces TaxID=2593676 RepID=UPI003646B3DA